MERDVDITSTKRIVLIALGSNVSCRELSPAGCITRAIRELRGVLPDLQSSRLFRTPCFPPGAGPDYVNATVAASWQGPGGNEAIAAQELLASLHRLEQDHGRERRTRWASRTLDLDLLAFGPLVLPDPITQTRWRDLPASEQQRRAPTDLILPHPRLQDRAFVLVPLAEVAPDWQHPLTGLTVLDMLKALPPDALAEVRPIGPEDQNGMA